VCVIPATGQASQWWSMPRSRNFLEPQGLAQEVTNCDAPTSVNGDALAIYASEIQRGQWLEPQLAGTIRSALAMTEPNIASSDASNISMSAVRDGDNWVLNGRKWWISGVLHPNCAFVIAVACTDADAPDEVHLMAIAKRELRRQAADRA
jgi:acyl-CoA dehydrogenase